MIKNYLLSAYRSFTKRLTYSLVNSIGLALGIACFILIGMWVQNELSFDKYHPESENIYRVGLYFKSGSVEMKSAISHSALLPALQESGKIINGARLYNPSASRTYLIKYENEFFDEGSVYYADSSILSVFKIDIIEGNRTQILRDPSSVIINSDIASKYFAEVSPIGKFINISGTDFEIRGVFKKLPVNTHFHPEFILPFHRLTAGKTPNWSAANYHTYIKVQPNQDVQDVINTVDELINKNVNSQFEDEGTFAKSTWTKLTDIHLRSEVEDELEAGGDISIVYIFLIIALAIILIACINYMNLATARASERAKEVGMRKALGAQKNQLIFQFLGESFITVIISMIVASLLVALALPAFNLLSGVALNFDPFSNLTLLISLVVLLVILTVVSGIYPALILSSFKSAIVLKGKVASSKSGVLFRRVLVVFSFLSQ